MQTYPEGKEQAGTVPVDEAFYAFITLLEKERLWNLNCND